METGGLDGAGRGRQGKLSTLSLSLQETRNTGRQTGSVTVFPGVGRPLGPTPPLLCPVTGVPVTRGPGSHGNPTRVGVSGGPVDEREPKYERGPGSPPGSRVSTRRPPDPTPRSRSGEEPRVLANRLQSWTDPPTAGTVLVPPPSHWGWRHLDPLTGGSETGVGWGSDRSCVRYPSQ